MAGGVGDRSDSTWRCTLLRAHAPAAPDAALCLCCFHAEAVELERHKFALAAKNKLAKEAIETLDDEATEMEQQRKAAGQVQEDSTAELSPELDFGAEELGEDADDGKEYAANGQGDAEGEEEVVNQDASMETTQGAAEDADDAEEKAIDATVEEPPPSTVEGSQRKPAVRATSADSLKLTQPTPLQTSTLTPPSSEGQDDNSPGPPPEIFSPSPPDEPSQRSDDSAMAGQPCDHTRCALHAVSTRSTVTDGSPPCVPLCRQTSPQPSHPVRGAAAERRKARRIPALRDSRRGRSRRWHPPQEHRRPPTAGRPRAAPKTGLHLRQRRAGRRRVKRARRIPTRTTTTSSP